MNERIQAIKNQCWVYRHWDKNGERWVDRHVDLDRFAELIIRECVSVCENEGYRLSMDTKTEHHRDLAKQCHKICSMMEKHFGVE